MSPPNVVDTQVRQRVVGDDETESKTPFESNYVPMNFTIKEIREAIPAHLFVRNTIKSIMYLLKDVATVASLAYCANFIDTLPSLALRIPAWIAYSIVQGTVMVGPFALAHGKHLPLQLYKGKQQERNSLDSGSICSSTKMRFCSLAPIPRKKKYAIHPPTRQMATLRSRNRLTA